MNSKNTSDNSQAKALNKTDVSGSYFDNVLIKLKRAYSKDETVLALSKKLTEVEIELGKSIAYIHELEDEKHQRTLKTGGEQWFEKYKKLKERFDKLDKEAKQDELYLMRSKENSRLHSELKKLRKVNNDLVNKICLLENKTSL
jgi:hypothetical protein